MKYLSRARDRGRFNRVQRLDAESRDFFVSLRAASLTVFAFSHGFCVQTFALKNWTVNDRECPLIYDVAEFKLDIGSVFAKHEIRTLESEQSMITRVERDHSTIS